MSQFAKAPPVPPPTPKEVAQEPAYVPVTPKVQVKTSEADLGQSQVQRDFPLRPSRWLPTIEKLSLVIGLKSLKGPWKIEKLSFPCKGMILSWETFSHGKKPLDWSFCEGIYETGAIFCEDSESRETEASFHNKSWNSHGKNNFHEGQKSRRTARGTEYRFHSKSWISRATPYFHGGMKSHRTEEFRKNKVFCGRARQTEISFMKIQNLTKPRFFTELNISFNRSPISQNAPDFAKSKQNLGNSLLNLIRTQKQPFLAQISQETIQKSLNRTQQHKGA